jgi:hypothetical protein
MGVFERRVWTEIRILRESEENLKAIYETLHGAGAEKERSFVASLRVLDERVRRLENLLESAA